jgi:hypothetical protein
MVVHVRTLFLILAVRRRLSLKPGLVPTVPAFVPRFVMIHRHRAPMMITVPTVHRIALATFTCQTIPLVLAMFTCPAFAFVIANLLMVLAPFKRFVRVMIIVSC